MQFFDEENADLEGRFLVFGDSNESRFPIVCRCECSVGKSALSVAPALVFSSRWRWQRRPHSHPALTPFRDD